MSHSTFARRARAIAGHADYLLIAALVAAKLAGVEVKVVWRDEPTPPAAAAAVIVPAAPFAPTPAPAVRLIRIDAHAPVADENACERERPLVPRAETRRELRERRARDLRFGVAPAPAGAPRRAS
jgi:hypothetical protein